MKQTQNQFFGLESQKPFNLPKGSIYVSVDIGKVYIYDHNEAAILVGDNGLGWASYSSNNYTASSRLSISQGETKIVDINKSSFIEKYLPHGVKTFYDKDTSSITPENVGDGYSFTLGFKGSSNTNNGSATIGIDIGGVNGQIFKRSFRFPRGTGIDHDFYYTSQGYSLNDFVSNGGKIKITSDTGTSELFNFTLQVHRTFSSKNM